MKALKAGGDKATVQVVYAPWCEFCQGMEEDYEKLAAKLGGDVTVAKYRGDEDREFVTSEFDVQSFPTINVISKDGKVTKYDADARDVDSLAAFVESTL
jgi:thioredoxin-like negative regulator of GroEL